MVAAAHEDQHLAVRRKRQPAQLLAIVGLELGDLARRQAGAVSDPDIAHPAHHPHPGNPVPMAGRRQVFHKRIGQRLLQGERRGLSHARRRANPDCRQYRR